MDDVSMDDPRATAYDAPEARSDLHCGECQALMVLRKFRETGALFYGCSRFPECKSTHGAFPSGAPLGVPGSRETARARNRLHQVFDRVWATGKMTRERAYEWMGAVAGVPNANIGMLNAAECAKVEEAIRVAFPTLKNVWERLRENPYEDASLGDDEVPPEPTPPGPPPKPKKVKKYRNDTDARVRCSFCRQWMRRGPQTATITATRRPAPHADRCLKCPPGPCRNLGTCNQHDVPGAGLR